MVHFWDLAGLNTSVMWFFFETGEAGYPLIFIKEASFGQWRGFGRYTNRSNHNQRFFKVCFQMHSCKGREFSSAGKTVITDSLLKFTASKASSSISDAEKRRLHKSSLHSLNSIISTQNYKLCISNQKIQLGNLTVAYNASLYVSRSLISIPPLNILPSLVVYWTINVCESNNVKQLNPCQQHFHPHV